MKARLQINSRLTALQGREICLDRVVLIELCFHIVINGRKLLRVSVSQLSVWE